MMKIFKKLVGLHDQRIERLSTFNNLKKKMVDDIERYTREIQDDKNEEIRRLNRKCGKCGSEDCIDRFADICGSGRVSGDFFLGVGSVSGESSIETRTVKQCSECGNQWQDMPTIHEYRSKRIGNFISHHTSIGGPDTSICYPGGKGLICKYPMEVVISVFNENKYSFQDNMKVKSFKASGWWTETLSHNKRITAQHNKRETTII